jgi:hypothetical protein
VGWPNPPHRRLDDRAADRKKQGRTDRRANRAAPTRTRESSPTHRGALPSPLAHIPPSDWPIVVRFPRPVPRIACQVAPPWPAQAGHPYGGKPAPPALRMGSRKSAAKVAHPFSRPDSSPEGPSVGQSRRPFATRHRRPGRKLDGVLVAPLRGRRKPAGAFGGPPRPMGASATGS